MDNEIQNMFDDFRDNELSKTTQEEFENIKTSIALQITTKDSDLKIRTARIWREIIDRDKDFNRRDKMLKILEKISLKDLIHFYDNKLNPKDKSKLRKMSFQMYSRKNYPELPKDLKNSTTPYIGINNFDEGTIEVDA